MGENYEVSITCWNCKERETVQIEKGETVNDFASKRTCKKCGCNMR